MGRMKGGVRGESVEVELDFLLVIVDGVMVMTLGVVVGDCMSYDGM